MSKVVYEVGQRVRIRANTCGHYFKIGEEVVLERIDSTGGADYACNGTERWWLDNDDVEPLPGHIPKAKAVTMKILKERPVGGKVIYAVTNKDGILHIEQDRDDARVLKATLGGKAAGVSIVQYAPVKEIR